MFSKWKRDKKVSKDDKYVPNLEAVIIKDYGKHTHTYSYLPNDNDLFSEKDKARKIRGKI